MYFCAEHLARFSRVYQDLRYNDGGDVLPEVTAERERLVEMRDRFDSCFQPLADPDGEVAEHPADRTTGNWVRYFVRNEYESIFG